MRIIDDLDNKVGEQEEEITDLKDQLQKELKILTTRSANKKKRFPFSRNKSKQ
jgi:hypothetical protein